MAADYPGELGAGAVERDALPAEGAAAWEAHRACYVCGSKRDLAASPASGAYLCPACR